MSTIRAARAAANLSRLVETIKLKKEGLDKDLHAAIKNYFAKKNHDGTGMFKEGEKQPTLERIRDACKRLGYGWEVVPGLVTIHMNNVGSLWFDKENQETGTLMTKETVNPWREMDKGRTVKSYEGLAQRHDEWLKEKN